MKTRNLLSALTITASLFAGSAHASIIYHVDRTIGNGSVIGTITTDGKLGNLITRDCLEHGGAPDCLPRSNIIAWDLLLNDGVDSFTINQDNSIYFNAISPYSTNFWATPNSLLYDFTSPGFDWFSYASEASLGYESPDWQLWEGHESVYAGPAVWDTSFTFEDYYAQTQTQQRGTEVIIGSVVTSVPEPDSLILLALGLASIGCTRRIKQG